MAKTAASSGYLFLKTKKIPNYPVLGFRKIPEIENQNILKTLFNIFVEPEKK